MEQVTDILGWVVYAMLVLIALWGAFCVIVVWRRVAQTNFSSQDVQGEFLDEVDERLNQNDFEAAAELCDGDRRAMPQLVLLALANRKIGYARLRHLLADHFQRDVLSDLEYRLSWVDTVIKSAPMIGLLGTVVGMIGAFGAISTAGKKVDPTIFADDIHTALYTTAAGLSIAIPLVLCKASINVRIRKLQDLVGLGLTRFMDGMKEALLRDAPPADSQPHETVARSAVAKG
jgi:biopolymer transport protein ExbB/TolQ